MNETNPNLLKTSYNGPYRRFCVFKIGQKPQFLIKNKNFYNFDNRFETNLNIF